MGNNKISSYTHLIYFFDFCLDTKVFKKSRKNDGYSQQVAHEGFAVTPTSGSPFFHSSPQAYAYDITKFTIFPPLKIKCESLVISAGKKTASF